MALGAQNAHVIRSGLLGKDVLNTSLTCFLCDFLLMVFGVFLLGELTIINIYVNITICILSIVFLLCYSVNAFIQAYKSKAAYETRDHQLLMRDPIWKTILTTLAVTLLNPHVYLDTVIIVGDYASSLSMTDKYFFISGALFSSFCWFFALGYLSFYLKNYLNNMKIWQILNIVIGIFMIFIAINIGIYLMKIIA
ncbi:LysE/ArgO family amino acid transporter [Bartonella tamiae]|uniref:L-lysine exporter n=1 Tax=Bartonella tamiae Th239 TaxID=1094558 RepID=J0ZPS3_9HYPH|nr:LysE family transporter [Bartonella tamiae]EJF90598.1 hypothetical protein ME5_00999 [Bartonella tamiae Th239]EJF94024.1 hypothetical protein MEG_00882 [Bartonella tamiae Th307]